MGKRILVAVIFVPLLAAVILFLPPVAFAILMAAITGLAAFELLRATANGLPVSLYCMTIMAAAAIALGQLAGDDHGQWISACVAVLLMIAIFFEAIRRYQTPGEVRFEQLLKCLFGGVLIPLLLSTLVDLRVMEQGRAYVVLVFLLVFLTDGGAYFAGVFLGKHKGMVRVSPNKSLEGYAGGLIAGIAAALLYGVVLHAAFQIQVQWLYMIVYGVAATVVTELGDLAFSLIKRQNRIKDFGHLLPGHGGVLDRFDSMTFAAPALYLLVQIIPALS